MDPSIVFAVACFFAPFALEVLLPRDNELLGSTQQVISFVFAWPVLFWLCVGSAVYIYTHSDAQKCVALSAAQRRRAIWYFVNGVFFVSMMDFSAGSLQAWPVMSERYIEMDERYAKPMQYPGIIVFMTSIQEVLVQAPCGLALYYAYYRNAPWRLAVEIIFNMASVGGVYYFYVADWVLGAPSMHPELASQFNFAAVYKFWTGAIIFPSLWGVIGLYNIWRSAVEIAALKQKQA